LIELVDLAPRCIADGSRDIDLEFQDGHRNVFVSRWSLVVCDRVDWFANDQRLATNDQLNCAETTGRA
jgi:hypothetical protein